MATESTETTEKSKIGFATDFAFSVFFRGVRGYKLALIGAAFSLLSGCKQ